MEITAVERNDKVISFGDEFPDGRLCEEPSSELYCLRDAIEMSEKLRRPLTDEEFRIKNNVEE